MKPGERVGRYVVEALLGEGGMGQVFRAYDEVLHRRVALKLIHAEPDAGPPSRAGGAVQRVLREARMAAALEHANVIAIHDVGEHEGTPFIVMELVTGKSLRALVGQSVPVVERIRWLVDIARALSAAHRIGLVHRDVKPENVIVREDGAVKVLDFGIARRATGGLTAAVGAALDATMPTQQQTSTIAGTPAYMAPEQIRGETIDARVDQFAWGVVAYEVLTGRLPWAGTNYLSAAIYDAPAPIDAAAVGVSTAVTAILSRALQKFPDARFSSMDELIAAIAPSLPSESGRDVTHMSNVPPASLPDFTSAPTLLATRSAASLAASTARIVRGKPGRRARLAAMVLAAVALATGGWWTFGPRRVPPPAPPAAVASSASASAFALHLREPHRLTFDPGCEEFPAFTPDGKTLVFDATFGEDSHVVALDLASRERKVITKSAGWQYAAALSPDGTKVAFLGHQREHVASYVVPLDGSAAPRLVLDGVIRPSWSPDGTAIWAGTLRRVDRVNVASGESTRNVEAPAGQSMLRALEVPDGRVVVAVLDRDRERSAGLVAFARDGSIAPLVTWETDETLTLAPDGSRLFTTRLLPNNRVELWQVPLDLSPPSVVGDGAVQPTKGLAVRAGQFVWSTCRTSQILAGLKSGTGAGTFEAEPLFPQPDWEDRSPAGIARSASKLVVVSNRSGKRQIWVLDTSGAEPPRMVPTGNLIPEEPAVSPDGRWVAFGVVEHGIHVMPLDGSAPPRALTERATDREPTFSRDGTTLYFDGEGAVGHRAIESVPIDGAAPPVLVIDWASHPRAATGADRLLYVAEEPSGAGTPRVFDLRTRASAPVSPALVAGRHSFAAFSPDGKRIAVTKGVQELLEVDAARGAVLRRYQTGDQITGVTYVGTRIVIARDVWGGDLWTAEEGGTPP